MGKRKPKNVKSETPATNPAVADNKPDTSMDTLSPAYRANQRVERRRKVRKITAIVTGVGGAGVLAMALAAFLGRISGNFTLKVNPMTADAHLSLSTDKDFTAPTSRLLGTGLENCIVTAADTVIAVGDEVQAGEAGGDNFTLTTEETVGGETYKLSRGLMYSTYLRNDSAKNISYNVNMVMDSYTSPSNGAAEPYSYLRVGVWQKRFNEDGSLDKELFKVYALASKTLGALENGVINYSENREFVSCCASTKDENGVTYRYATETKLAASAQLADTFLDGNSHIFYQYYEEGTDFEINRLLPGQKARYTFGIWLEGNDPDCQGSVPAGTSMAFNIQFSPSTISE